MLHFTSDLHFFHENVIQYTNRPFECIHDMHEGLIFNWNSQVSEDDDIWVLGDFSFGNKAETASIVARLKGRKHLVKGNHDKHSDSAYQAMGFQTVVREAVIKIAGKRFRLSHYPPSPPESITHLLEPKDLRYIDRRPSLHGVEFVMHGHTHSTWCQKDGRAIHVGVDAWGMKPVRQGQIESLISKPESQISPPTDV